MIRSTRFTTDRRPWIAAALFTLALAACGSTKPKVTGPADGRQTTAPSTPAIPAGSPGVTREVPPPPRVLTYEDAESVFKAGRYSEAMTLFTTFVEANPENASGYYMLGLSTWKSGDPRGAERAFEQAIEKDPSHVKSLRNSARVLIELGRPHEALDRVNVARTVDSTSSETLRLLARVQDELGDTASAIKSYREALVRDERDVWAMNNLGMLYIRQGDFQSALGPLARAVQIRPTSPVFQNNLGIALELAGHPAQAKTAYGDALKADSSFAKAVANAKRLGEIAADLTKPDVDVRELAELFRQYVKLWKDSVPDK